MSAPLSYAKVPALLTAGLERLLKANEGARLDKRAVTVGYWAAAAIFAASQGVSSDIVEMLTNRAQVARDRKESGQ